MRKMNEQGKYVKLNGRTKVMFFVHNFVFFQRDTESINTIKDVTISFSNFIGSNEQLILNFRLSILDYRSEKRELNGIKHLFILIH